MKAIVEAFSGRPSAMRYMPRAFRRRPGLQRSGGFPPLTIHWKDFSIEPGQWRRCRELTGITANERLALLFPHVAGFRALMALLTHPAFPVPIWRSLQIRNHLLCHRPLIEGERLDLEARVSAQRILDKGAEVDLHTRLAGSSGLAWESVNTFYYRGRFGEAQPAPALARAPDVAGPEIGRWRTGSGTGWSMGQLTGDYNPIHWWNGYARRFGFNSAFHHPQLVVGQILARLPAPAGGGGRLDLWLKGPVGYGAEVRLCTAAAGAGLRFSLALASESRPAIVGHWHGAGQGAPLS